MTPQFWKDTVVARLKELCASTLYSNASIASILNHEFNLSLTRSAVIGKRSRDGLKGAPKARSGERIKRKPHPNGVKFTSRKPVTRTPPVKPVEMPILDMAAVAEHACGLMALRNETCRFPYGEVGRDGFFFCGALQADLANGRPYCKSHMWIARQHRI